MVYKLLIIHYLIMVRSSAIFFSLNMLIVNKIFLLISFVNIEYKL